MSSSGVAVLAAVVLGAALGAALAWAVAQGRSAARLAGLAAQLDAERRLAAERDGRLSAAAQAELAARSAAVRDLVSPVATTLAGLDDQLRSLELARVRAQAELGEQVASLAQGQTQLRRTTGALVTALRAPRVRGRWGEVQLRRVCELAGMVEHCDFTEQPTFFVDALDGPAGRLRPDLVVHLPGGGAVVVDAKAPLEAYLEAVELSGAGDDDADDQIGLPSSTQEFATGGVAGAGRAQVAERLAAHARQVRAHVDELASRNYARAVPGAVELVVLFVPGEAVLSAALEVDPGLLEHAARRRVVLASPMTLLAVLTSIAQGWRQASVTQNAQAVIDLGHELHARLAGLVDKVGKLGRSLDGAVRSYNETVASLESRVLVSARRLGELGVASEELPAVEPLERLAREPREEPYR
jgi:DNA recombination protein RmuC